MRRFLLIFCLATPIIPLTEEESISDLLQKQNWKQADRELAEYMRKKPERSWAWSSRSWVLENLKKYDEAIGLCREGMLKFPEEKKITVALARVLMKKAENSSPESAHPLYEEAARLDPREYTEFSLARSFRNRGDFEQAIRLMQEGKKKYPDSERFADGLEYTRYQYFKALKKSGDRSALKKLIEENLSVILTGRYNQYYPGLILRFGLREIGDRNYFQSVYDRLFAKFPDEPRLHDDYGFQLYANYRIHGRADKTLRDEAIGWRRKAYELYWKGRKKPETIRLPAFPLRGRNMIWAEFGGTAMTHNGFSHYCYDFAAADAERNITRPGSSGKKNEDYYMFGSPVYSVADGEVTGIIDGYPDNAPGGFSGDANTITIRHNGYLSFYAHMKDGGIRVREKQKVRRGDLIGYAGNSGMSSESHLHFCLRADAEDEISLPFQFPETAVEAPDGKQRRSDAFYREQEVVIFPEK